MIKELTKKEIEIIEEVTQFRYIDSSINVFDEKEYIFCNFAREDNILIIPCDDNEFYLINEVNLDSSACSNFNELLNTIETFIF